MEAAPGILTPIFEKAETYFITTLKLTKLKQTHTETVVMSVVAFKIIVIVLISLLFYGFSIGAGLWLGELLGKSYYGFFAVSILYLVLIIGVHLFFQKWFKRIYTHSIPKTNWRMDMINTEVSITREF